MNPTTSLFASAAVSLGLLVGCGAMHDAASRSKGAAGASASLTPVSLKLYTSPDMQPLPSCDIFTTLTLTSGLLGPLAALRNERDGSCEIMVDPQDRAYNLEEGQPDCGSRVYTGTRKPQSLEEPIAVKIVDHRSRRCRDVPLSTFIVEERYRDGEVIVLYGRETMAH